VGIWNALDCGLCGMMLPRTHWLRGRPRASLLRTNAARYARWKRLSFDQHAGIVVSVPDTAGLPSSKKPKGVTTLDVCATCARRGNAEMEQEYRRRFVHPGGSYLESFDE
jgi:hypothetical protein